MIVLIGGLLIGFYTVALAILGERVAARDLAVANAAFLIAYQTGAMIGPVVAGAAMSLVGSHGFIATMVGGALVMAVVLIGLARPR